MTSSRRSWLRIGALIGIAAGGAAGLLAVERAGAERPPAVEVIDLGERPSPTSTPTAGSSPRTPGQSARPEVPVPTRSGDPARLVRPVPVPAGPKDDGPAADGGAVRDDVDDGPGTADDGADDSSDGTDDGTDSEADADDRGAGEHGGDD